jgi:hypothetical protein
MEWYVYFKNEIIDRLHIFTTILKTILQNNYISVTL